MAAILHNATSSDNQIAELEGLFSVIKTNMEQADAGLQELDTSLDNSTQRGFLLSLAMADLGSRISEIQMVAEALKANATRLQEADVDGALSLTRQARERAQKAHDRVELVQQNIGDSERQRRRTEALLTRVAPQLSESQQKNADELVALGVRLEVMEQSLPDLNNQVQSFRLDINISK